MMRNTLYPALLIFVALSNVAKAVQTYPAEIKTHLGLSYVPPCTLCHASNEGGLGTVVTPFGKSMMSAGLNANGDTLDPALDRVGAQKVDSNDDGVADIEELKNAVDPNTGVSYSGIEPQQYGCGARIATRSSALDGYLVFGGLIVLRVVRRIKQPNSRERLRARPVPTDR